MKRKLGSVRDTKGEWRTDAQGVADAFADFYANLYSSAQGPVGAIDAIRPQARPVARITAEEVEGQLKKMARGKAADRKGIVAEMLRFGGAGLLQVLADVFNDILVEEQMPPRVMERDSIDRAVQKRGCC